MIINEKELKKQRIITVAAAVAIGLILIFLVTAYRPAFPYYWSIAIEVVCGAVLAVSLGLCINEETRIAGILYASLMILTPLFSIIGGAISSDPVTMDVLLPSYGIGFAAGAIYTLVMLKRGKTDRLGIALPKLLKVFVALIALIIIIYSIILPLYENISYWGFPSSITFDYLQPYLIPLIGLILMFILAKSFIFNHSVGIDGSSVFVIGPPSSGKTYLAIGLWEHFCHNTHIEEHETPALNMERPEDGGDNMRLSNLRDDLLEKGTLPHTKIGQLSTYAFILKKFFFIPTRWTVMDYPGEKYTDFHIRSYNRALTVVLERLQEIDRENGNQNRVWTEQKIVHMAKTLELIPLVQEEYAVRDAKYIEFMESIVILIMYVNFRNSGKIIFLIDGNQFKNEWLEKHDEDRVFEPDETQYSGESTVNLNKAFGEYNRILAELSKVNPRKTKKITKLQEKEEKLLASNGKKEKIEKISEKRQKLENNNEISKKAAFVVTKTDILCQECQSLQTVINKHAPRGVPGTFDLSEIRENKDATTELEEKLFGMLDRTYPNFRYCMAKLNKQHVPTYFIAGSLDSTTPAGGIPGERMGELHLFGFSSLEKFGK